MRATELPGCFPPDDGGKTAHGGPVRARFVAVRWVGTCPEEAFRVERKKVSECS